MRLVVCHQLVVAGPGARGIIDGFQLLGASIEGLIDAVARRSNLKDEEEDGSSLPFHWLVEFLGLTGQGETEIPCLAAAISISPPLSDWRVETHEEADAIVGRSVQAWVVLLAANDGVGLFEDAGERFDKIGVLEGLKVEVIQKFSICAASHQGCDRHS